MSRRLNMSGFSMKRMRALLRSGDEDAVARISGGLIADHPYWPTETREQARAIVDRAVMIGTPFDDLAEESSLHLAVAAALARDGQEHRDTMASAYGADTLERGLWPQARKHGRPETRAFVRGLVEGVPIFGTSFPPDSEVYAAVGLEKLKFFRPGLADLREQVVHRAGAGHETSEFVAECCGWIDEIIDAGLDLWYATG